MIARPDESPEEIMAHCLLIAHPQWMQRPAAAKYLGIDAGTLDKYTMRDGIPYHTPRNSKLKLYNKVDLDAWGRGNTWN